MKIKGTKTIKTFVGTGSQTVYNFGMDYIRKDFIYVTIDGISLEKVTDFTIYKQELTIKVAPPLGSIVVIRRITSPDPLVVWQDASVMRTVDLTTLEVQLRHLQEEEVDRALGVEDTQHIQLDRCLKAPLGFIGDLPDPLEAGEFLRVNDQGTAIVTAPIGVLKWSKSIDGGNARSVYTDTQVYDGGSARG